MFNRRNQLGKTGKAPIEIRVIIARISYYLATGFKIYPEHWDKKQCKVNKKCPDWNIINSAIGAMVEKIDTLSTSSIRSGQDPDIDAVKSLFSKQTSDQYDFIEFARAEINKRTDLKTSTLNGHLTQLNYLQGYCEGKLLFDQITFGWVTDFDQYMTRDGKRINTRWKYHKFIKTYLNVAIKKRISDVYPYDQFKAKRQEGNRDALTLAELKELEVLNRECLSTTQANTLDKFLFSCYTGLRISDIETLSTDSFTVDGDKVYMTIKQQKSERMVRNVPLHKLFNGKALEIFLKYFNHDEKLLFPALSSKEINRQLKNIASFTGIKKVLTFHMARHTFGSALAEMSKDVLMIKNLMGHSKIETSMIYIHMSRERLENKLDQVDFNY